MRLVRSVKTLCLLGALTLTACATRKEPEWFPTLSGPARPFSPAVRANGFLFLSGQIGTDSTGRLVPGGIQAETRQTMNNIRDVLRRAGSSFDKVVKCTVFILDMAEWPAMNEVYITYFTKLPPARSAAGSSGLALGARVEIECIAAD
jgi:2-iminobutanoate/2-iminopropanoate deaminase